MPPIRRGRSSRPLPRVCAACSSSRRPGTETITAPDGAELLVVVPALASTGESLTGAVDDRRQDAEATAAALEARLPGARVEVGADDPALAVEDAYVSSERTRCSSLATTGCWRRSASGSRFPSVAPSPSYFPAELETYSATAWIWAGLSFPLNAGISPPPTIT